MTINGESTLKLLSVLFFLIGVLFFATGWLSFQGIGWSLPFNEMEWSMAMIGISLAFLGAAAFRSKLKPYAWVVSCYALTVLYWAALIFTLLPEIDHGNQIKFTAVFGGFPVSLVLVVFGIWKKEWFFVLLGFVPAMFSFSIAKAMGFL